MGTILDDDPHFARMAANRRDQMQRIATAAAVHGWVGKTLIFPNIQAVVTSIPKNKIRKRRGLDEKHTWILAWLSLQTRGKKMQMAASGKKNNKKINAASHGPKYSPLQPKSGKQCWLPENTLYCCHTVKSSHVKLQLVIKQNKTEVYLSRWMQWCGLYSHVRTLEYTRTWGDSGGESELKRRGGLWLR